MTTLNLGKPISEVEREAWINASVPAVVMDTILPPALAHDIGLGYAARARAIREGRATLEGVFMSYDRCGHFMCACMEGLPTLTEQHPRRQAVAHPVVRAFRDNGAR